MLIPEEELAEIIRRAEVTSTGFYWGDDVSETILKVSELQFGLKNYLILSNRPEFFAAHSPLTIWYSRYYWFVHLCEESSKHFGFDASLEQQLFKLIEEGARFPEIDWDYVESIEHQARGR